MKITYYSFCIFLRILFSIIYYFDLNGRKYENYDFNVPLVDLVIVFFVNWKMLNFNCVFYFINMNVNTL